MTEAIVESGPRGTVKIRWLAPEVMLTTLSGHCDEALAAVHIREAAGAYRKGARLQHFFDVDALAGYDSAARVALTGFAIEHRAQVRSAVFLVRSKIVAMGVSTAALAARLVGLEFVVLSDRAEFERRVRAAR